MNNNSLIKLAAALPKGSEERRVLLAAIQNPPSGEDFDFGSHPAMLGVVSFLKKAKFQLGAVENLLLAPRKKGIYRLHGVMELKTIPLPLGVFFPKGVRVDLDVIVDSLEAFRVMLLVPSLGAITFVYKDGKLTMGQENLPLQSSGNITVPF